MLKEPSSIATEVAKTMRLPIGCVSTVLTSLSGLRPAPLRHKILLRYDEADPGDRQGESDDFSVACLRV